MYQPNYSNYQFRYPVMPGFVTGGMPMTPMTPMSQGMGTTQPQQGMTGGGTPTGQVIPGTGAGTTGGAQAPDFQVEPGAPVQNDILYTQGWLRTQIGQKVKIEFLIGTDMLVDRDGTLLDVGISYVIINETETDDLLMCDIYSIKFVRVYK